VIVAGARGVFGTHLVRELGDDYDVVPTTRDTLDLDDVDAVARFARGAYAFACTAGPFQQLDRRIVRAVVDAGASLLCRITVLRSNSHSHPNVHRSTVEKSVNQKFHTSGFPLTALTTRSYDADIRFCN
jgi:hypothetical protein